MTTTRIVVPSITTARAPHQTPTIATSLRIGSTKREAEGSEIALCSLARELPRLKTCANHGRGRRRRERWYELHRDLEGETFRGSPTVFQLGGNGDEACGRLRGSISSQSRRLLLFAKRGSSRSSPQKPDHASTRFSRRPPASPVVERGEFVVAT